MSGSGSWLKAAIGPLVLLAAFAGGGAAAGSWAGAAAGAVAALAVILGVAAAAAAWAARIGRALAPQEAWQVAPRPPLFGGLCDAVYRRALGGGDEDRSLDP